MNPFKSDAHRNLGPLLALASVPMIMALGVSGTAISIFGSHHPDLAYVSQHLSIPVVPRIGLPEQGRHKETLDAQYFYGGADEYATATGALGTFLVEAPFVAAMDSHSLAELAIESSDGQQIVEVGWTVDPGQFGDSRPHLFVYHWVNGLPSCYDGCGFVPTSATTTAGMPLIVGESDVFEINWGDSHWNLYDNGVLFGYFPDSIWGGTFTSLGLAQWFGEVAAGSTKPCSQMGDGQLADSAGADTINNMGFLAGPPVSVSWYSDTYYTSLPTSANSIRFGGPGACAPSTTTIASTSPTRPIAGQSMRVHVSVTGQSTAMGAVAPSGSVSISDGTGACLATIFGSDGMASGSCVIAGQSAGSKDLVAKYGGDQNFDPSTSNPVRVAIGKAPSWTRLVESASKVTYGREHELHLVVIVRTRGSGATPSGSVLIRAGSRTICSAILRKARASCSPAPRSLAPGSYHLDALFAGDRNFKGSKSATVALVILQIRA